MVKKWIRNSKRRADLLSLVLLAAIFSTINAWRMLPANYVTLMIVGLTYLFLQITLYNLAALQISVKAIGVKVLGALLLSIIWISIIK